MIRYDPGILLGMIQVIYPIRYISTLIRYDPENWGTSNHASHLSVIGMIDPIGSKPAGPTHVARCPGG